MWWKKNKTEMDEKWFQLQFEKHYKFHLVTLSQDLMKWQKEIEEEIIVKLDSFRKDRLEELLLWKKETNESILKGDKIHKERWEKHVQKMEAHADQVEQYLFTQTNLVRALMEKLEK